MWFFWGLEQGHVCPEARLASPWLREARSRVIKKLPFLRLCLLYWKCFFESHFPRKLTIISSVWLQFENESENIFRYCVRELDFIFLKRLPRIPAQASRIGPRPQELGFNHRGSQAQVLWSWLQEPGYFGPSH